MRETLPSETAKVLYDALLEAGDLALRLQSDSLTKLSKGGKDFATEADVKVQQLLQQRLEEHLPEIKILGEEDANLQIPRGEFLAIDPIDGTFLYSVGSKAWGISIALIAEGKPKIGFLYQPARQQIAFAEKGHGTFVNAERVQLSTHDVLAESIISLAQGCWNTEEEMQQVNVPLSCASLFALCPGSAVDAAFELLTGVSRAYLNYRGYIWDFAALAILVEEAGGVVSAPSGADRSWDTLSVPCLFACNSAIQQEILAILPEEFKYE